MYVKLYKLSKLLKLDKIDLYCNYVNLALCSQMGDHYMYTYVQLDRPWVFQTSNGTFFLCNFSQCFSKGSHFHRIVSQKRLCCADIFSYSLSIHFTMSRKKRHKCLKGRHKGVMERQATSDILLMYSIHIFSWINTTGVWLEARGSHQKMLLLYRKPIKPYVSAAATERFNPYTPLPQSVFPLEFKGTKLSLNPLILYTGTKSVLILLRRLYGQHYNQQIYTLTFQIWFIQPYTII